MLPGPHWTDSCPWKPLLVAPSTVISPFSEFLRPIFLVQQTWQLVWSIFLHASTGGHSVHSSDISKSLNSSTISCHPPPPPPFQTLHQPFIAVKCEFTLFTLLEGSIWSGLLLISNLISYHNIPNPASAVHHIGLLTIHKHVGFYPASSSLCMQFPSGLKCPFSFCQPTPHTVQLTLDTQVWTAWVHFHEDFFNSKYFSTTLSWFVEFTDAEDPWIQRADYKVNANEPLCYSRVNCSYISQLISSYSLCLN